MKRDTLKAADGFQEDLGQFLSSEVERDGLGVPRVVHLDVDLVVVLVLADQRRLQTRHLVLLAVDENLQNQDQHMLN